MKNKIKEIKDYFINKITACDFDSVEILYGGHGWVHVKTIIDGLNINFGIHIEKEYYCSHDSDLRVEVPDDRLSNLIELIKSKNEDFRIEKIEKLKAELAELEKNI